MAPHGSPRRHLANPGARLAARPHRLLVVALTTLAALAAPDRAQADTDPTPPALSAPPPNHTAADLKAEADRLFRAGDLAGAATTWAELAARLEPGSPRYLLIWKALNAWERAYASDHDPRHLCAARDLALAVLREHLRQDHRLEFELRLDALDRALADLDSPSARCIAETTSQPPASAWTASTIAPIPTTTSSPTPTTSSSATPSTPSPTPTAAASTPSTTSPAAPSTADAPLDRPAAARRSPSARPFLIAGAVTLPLGVAFLGLMTHGLLEDARAADDLRTYAAKNSAVGLTPDEAAAARDALARGHAGTRLAIGTGITAGALLLTGAALLAHGQRLRARHLALRPALTPTAVGLTLTGSF